MQSVTVVLTYHKDEMHSNINKANKKERDRLYGLVVGVLGYRSRGPGSIPGTTRIKK
jgi:hypothetical protein